MTVAKVPGSFRDPGNQVYSVDGRIIRAVSQRSAADYEAFRDSGLLARLIQAGRLVDSTEIPPSLSSFTETPAYLLEHPRLPMIAYPYEWPFALLKRAALFHLDLQLEALEAGFMMNDASAYNVQFRGCNPVFIDHLSFRPYVEGEIWAAHRQFCMQFLNPLILWSKKGVSPNHWFRGGLEGLAPEDLSPLLSLRDKLSWTIMTHVSGQAAFQRRAVASKSTAPGRDRARLSRTGLQGMLEGLRSFITRCQSPSEGTVWSDYAGQNSYDRERAGKKREFVSRAVERASPHTLIDMGCNSGEYSEVALAAGAVEIFGFDFDFGALEGAVGRATEGNLQLLPLWLDAANPSPSQGWAQSERPGFSERARADFVIALAFIHHIAISRNVPLAMVIDWIMEIAPRGVIEFVPKTDPMVQRLLSNREDIFADYDETSFLSCVQSRGQVVERAYVAENGRFLVAYER